MLFDLFRKKVNYAELIQNGAIIIDVRTPGEFKSGHIKGSKNIPLDSINAQINSIKKTGKTVIVCCQSGMRSGVAKSMLKKHGLDVYNGGSWTSLSRKI